MRIKKGDNVIVIAGKDKGKTGEVLKAMPAESRVVVKGISMAKRHERSRKGNQKGQIVEKAMPIHVSNVMLLDPKGGKRTRVGIKREKGSAVRIARKSGAEFK